mgnify:CR=1 FL=1|jgi:hypothetical protein
MKKLLCFLSIWFFITSCNNDDNLINKSSDAVVKIEGVYNKKEGFLQFKNEGDLKNSYFKLKELEDTKKSFNKFYEEGFLPLNISGYLSEKEAGDFHLRKQAKRKKTSRREGSFSEISKNFIQNELFTNLLNDEGEIQVANKIYKYTEKGIFIVHKENKHLLSNIEAALLNKSDLIRHYIPNKNLFPNFTIRKIEDSRTRKIPEQDEHTRPPSHYAHYTYTNDLPSNTSHYNYCENSKDGWIDNIFGRSYACEYKFNRKKKLRTVFAAEDFYFFTDVYAQAKFKQKTWFGWFSDRSADRVYLLNKKIILKVKESKFELPTFWTNEKEVKKIFDKIVAFFTSKPKSTIQYVSNVYDLDSKTTEIYEPTFEELIKSANDNQIMLAAKKDRKPFLDIDVSLKNFFGEKVNKAVVVNLMGKEIASLKNTQILKIAADVIRKEVFKLNKGQTGGIVFIGQNPENQKVAPIAYSVFGEKIEVRKLAVASRDFEIPSNTKLDKLVIGFRTDGNSRSYGLGFSIKWNIVNSVDIDIESGAKYQGKWGGSKFKVIY